MSKKRILFVLLALVGIPALSLTTSREPLKGAESTDVTKSASKGTTVIAEDQRRCAYLGKWGSFHLIGSAGSAAYALGNDRFIADLTFVREDTLYWYYRPSKGDASTTLWAFARRPYCGKYWVWRHAQGGWKRYEATRAWGDGLGAPTTAQTAIDVVDQLQLRVQDLENRVKTLESNGSAPPTITAIPMSTSATKAVKSLSMRTPRNTPVIKAL